MFPGGRKVGTKKKDDGQDVLTTLVQTPVYDPLR